MLAGFADNAAGPERHSRAEHARTRLNASFPERLKGWRACAGLLCAKFQLQARSKAICRISGTRWTSLTSLTKMPQARERTQILLDWQSNTTR
jgi:hypothetical protein